MEIKDYLRVLGKRAWLLVMIPAVAGVVAGLIAVGQPQAFRTTATLQLPRDETTTPAQVAQLVADFQAAADNPTVQNQVSEESGVPVRRIQRVRIAQVGDSSQLTMSFQDKRKDATEAKAVINGLAGGALSYLQTPELRNAQQAVDAASGRIEESQKQIDEANAQLDAIYAEVKTNRPQAELEDLRAEKRFYEREELASLAGGNPAAAAAYRTRVEEANIRILALERVMPDVEALAAQIATATETDTAAEEELAVAQEKLATVGFEPDLTFSAEGQSVVRKTRVVKTAAAAVVAGFPIAIGVVLLLDAFQKRRANRPARPDHDAELAGAADDEYELESATSGPVPGSPALIGAAAGPAGLPAASAATVVAEDADDEYDDLDDEDEAVVVDADEVDEDDEDEAVVVDDVVIEEDLQDEDIEDELEDDIDGDIDDELQDDVDDDLEDELEDDVAVAEDAAELDAAELDEAELDDLALPELDEDELEADLDEADLGEDLEDELDDDVAATVASRRRLYNADIDDDLSVDGGPGEHDGPEQNGPETNGRGRVWARVPAADSDFDGDDEAGADR